MTFKAGDSRVEILEVTRHNDEEHAPPGWESVVINHHMLGEKAAYQMKDYDLLGELVYALGIATHLPGVPPEDQGRMEIARMLIWNHLQRGSELPPMTLRQDRVNPKCMILRAQIYVPKEPQPKERKVEVARQGLELANEVADFRW